MFVEQFRDYVEDNLQETFDEIYDVARSKHMARYFAERVLSPRNPALLPSAEEDIAACAVDGKGDQGVDFICREGGVVLIIQAKYSGGGRKASKRRPEDPADFDSFRNVLSRLRNYRTLVMNEPLRELAAEIDWDKDRFQLYYITLRQLAVNQANIAEWNVTPMPDLPDLLDRTELQLLDETKLNQELRDTLSLDKSEPWIAELIFTDNEESPPWTRLGSDDGRGCYVGRISGAQLAVLFTQHKSSLFTLNIRNYIGDTATNKAIRKTAVESPEDFFFFNNGISALAESVEPHETDKRILRCKNLSIVNGAQTVRSLHKAQMLNRDSAREVQVLIRLTETESKKTSAEQEFLDSLTKFNNTQNAIRISDFRSNDKIQHDIKSRFSALPSLGGRKFSYKNKRSGPGEREAKRGGDISIGMEEFTKTLFAFVFGADDAYGGAGYVFDATTEGGYAKLFGSGGEVLPSLGNETFEYYAGIWFVCSHAKGLWRDESRKTKHSALERRWMFYYGLGEVLRKAYEGEEERYKRDLRKLSHTGWLGDENGANQKVISRLSRIAFQVLRQAYDESVKTGTSHRNWFRSQATLRLITTRVADSWELVAEHAEDYRFQGRPK
ncbi:MAG TPA: AIPR family protein [Bryobacteraceae bacterium]|nr:AIPR family protein [Bryobacteraceae bacterium]